MSGGHFDYQQHRFSDIAHEIDVLVLKNGQVGYAYNYPDDIIQRFREAVIALRRAAHMVHCIDYLVCGDIDEETFRERWGEKA